MSKPYVRPAHVDDCAELAVTMREADMKEVALAGSTSPYASLMRGFANSDSPQTVIGRHGEVVAIFGVVALAPGMGSPWMLASDSLEEIKKPFLRECRSYLDAMHARFPLLFNQVWEGNTVHIRWLKWLGFTVNPVPTNQPNFLPFWRHHHV